MFKHLILASNIILFTVFILAMLLMSYRREVKKRIVFFGDSITEQGAALTGYISLINRQIEAEDLVKKYQTINSGKSGNRIYDLLFRVDKDVVAKSPHITVIFIGINDVWCKIKNGTGLDIDRFENFYRALLAKILAANSKIVLCTPSVIGEQLIGTNMQDEDLDNYCHVIRKLAAEYNVELCDLRQAFTKAIAENNYENVAHGFLTTDGVHLNEEGNKLVARHIWLAIKTIK